MPSPIVSSGQTLTISPGQTSNGVSVLSGGVLDVLSGGTAVTGGVAGTEILAGGTDSGSLISSGGVEVVSSGGLAVGDTVSSGATQTISSGGLASGGTVRGLETVLSGGVTSGVTVSSGSFFSAGEAVSGGRAVGTVLAGGQLTVSGLTSTTFNGASATTTVLAAGVASNTVVNSGTVYVYAGGSTTGTVVTSSGGFAFGASEYVESGGVANGTTVNIGGTQFVFGSGLASGTVLRTGGQQSITSGTALNDVTASGSFVGLSGTLAYTEAVGTSSTLNANVSGGGTLAQSGPGTLVVSGSLATFNGTAVISGGTLELSSAGAAGSATIDFAANTAGTLRVDGAIGPANLLFGFNLGDTIDLAGLAYAGSTTPTISGNTVTVTEGAATETLTIAGANTDLFTLASDGAGGTDVRIACYCPGTLIRTDFGEVPVETLAIGDRVVTLAGAAEPVRWIGRRSYAGRFLAGKRHLLPVRIKAGALGDGLPCRDLLVSPNHAMFIDGVLIPAIQLVNGTSVVQEQEARQVEYVHVELAAHAVIYAEGAPSETYLDDDNRSMFHNAAEFTRLYGQSAAPVRYCAPRVEDGFALEAVRARLACLHGPARHRAA